MCIHSTLLMIAFLVGGFFELILHYSTIQMNIIRWVLSRIGSPLLPDANAQPFLFAPFPHRILMQESARKLC